MTDAIAVPVWALGLAVTGLGTVIWTCAQNVTKRLDKLDAREAKFAVLENDVVRLQETVEAAETRRKGFHDQMNSIMISLATIQTTLSSHQSSTSDHNRLMQERIQSVIDSYGRLNDRITNLERA